MTHILSSGKAGRIPSIFLTCLALAAVMLLAAPARTQAQIFQLQAGSVGGDNYSVQAYGGAAQANPSFLPNGFLSSPGMGYGTLLNTVGNFQTDTGGINAPNGNLAGGLATAANAGTLPNASFGVGALAYQSSNAGILWSNYFQSDSAAGNTFSTNNSRGIATYAVNGIVANGQAGIVLPIAGFVPPGAQGFAALVGTFTLTAPGGAVIQSAQDAVIITAQNNGSGLFNGVQNVSIPIAGGVAQGVAANSSSSFVSNLDGQGDLLFNAYGIALLPGVNYLPGDTLRIDGTLSIAVDPITFRVTDLLPLPLPPFPIIGLGPSTTPEPSSFMLGAMSIVIGLGFARWRHRRQAA
jgi:hypothetical protein